MTNQTIIRFSEAVLLGSILVAADGCRRTPGPSKQQPTSASLPGNRDEELIQSLRDIQVSNPEDSRRIEKENVAIISELESLGADALPALKKHLDDQTVIRNVAARPPDTTGTLCSNLVGFHQSAAFLKKVGPQLRKLDAESLIEVLATSPYRTRSDKPGALSTRRSVDWFMLMGADTPDDGYTTEMIIRDGNTAIRQELLARGKTVLPVLERHKDDARGVYTGANGPPESVRWMCEDLIGIIGKSETPTTNQ